MFSNSKNSNGSIRNRNLYIGQGRKKLSPVELTKKQVKAKLYSCFDFEQVEELLGKPEEGILLLGSALE